MTHKNINTKFMIEYDKANVTSSYPSLTDYERATILDRAYNALIAQKMTGNNIRRTPFEYDVKAISDLQPLVVTEQNVLIEDNLDSRYNVVSYYLPNLTYEFLYFVGASLEYHVDNPADEMQDRACIVNLVDHQTANKFIASNSNLPWIKQPVAYIENNNLCVVYDPYDKPDVNTLCLTYIKAPKKFVGDNEDDEFELNDTMAEELISLAVAFALENVESPRLNSKINTRGLEA